MLWGFGGGGLLFRVLNIFMKAVVARVMTDEAMVVVVQGIVVGMAPLLKICRLLFLPFTRKLHFNLSLGKLSA